MLLSTMVMSKKWFKKKDPIVKPKIKLTRKVYDIKGDEYFDVGYTNVKVTMLDGREIITKVYGYVSQYKSRGGSHYRSEVKYDDSCGPIAVTKSSQTSQDYIRLFSHEDVVIPDCPRTPTKSIIGKVSAYEILDSHELIEQHTVWHLVDEEYEIDNP